MISTLYIQKGTDLTVNPPLGFGLLGFDSGLVTLSIVIQKEKQFNYYNKRFETALNNGVISQDVYDAIIENQDEARQVYVFNTDLDIEKENLLNLVDNYKIPNVDPDGTAAEIVEDIINEGYQIVNKI